METEDQRMLYSYFESRGIARKLVNRAKIGYVRDGKMWGYLVFPVWDNGEICWWQARRFKNRFPKFFNPPSSRKSELVYRIGKARKPRRLVLVESVMNTLTLQNPKDSAKGSDVVIGIFGKTLSQIQMDKVLFYERHCEEVIVALDPDAIRDAVEIASQFEGVIPSVKIPLFPEGEDVNSLGRETAWDFIQKAKLYSSRNRMKFLARKSA